MEMYLYPLGVKEKVIMDATKKMRDPDVSAQTLGDFIKGKIS